MSRDSAIVIFKGIAHVIVGVFTPWSAALAQWIGTNSWPERIVWLGVILPASAIGGASSLLAFLSGSYQNYVAKIEENGDILPAGKHQTKVKTV